VILVQEIRECLYEGYQKVPDNLPEQISRHNLLDGINNILGGPAQGHHILPIVLVTEDSHTRKSYQSTDLKYSKDWRGKYAEYLDTTAKDDVETVDPVATDETEEEETEEEGTVGGTMRPDSQILVPSVDDASETSPPADLGPSAEVHNGPEQDPNMAVGESQAVAGSDRPKRARAMSTDVDAESSDRDTKQVKRNRVAYNVVVARAG